MYGGQTETTQPRTDEERLVRDLWVEVLKISPDVIGANSSFFHLGGDSVTAMRMVSVARSKNRLLTVADIFRLATVSEIAQNWVSAEAAEHSRQNPESLAFSLLSVPDLSRFLAEVISKPFQIEVTNIVDVLPATLHQSIDFYKPSPVLTFNFGNNVEIDHVLRSWRQVVQQYDILRTVFIPYQKNYLQVVLKGLDHDIEYHTMTEESNENVSENDSVIGGLIAGRSSLKIVIVKTKQGISLTLYISHAQYDGWSIEELLKTWENFIAGSPLSRQTKPQFPDYVYAKTARMGQDGAYKYWQRLLSAAKTTCFHEFCVDASLNSEIQRIRTTRTVESIIIPKDFNAKRSQLNGVLVVGISINHDLTRRVSLLCPNGAWEVSKATNDA